MAEQIAVIGAKPTGSDIAQVSAGRVLHPNAVK